jgi:hypothetical protein
MWNYSDAHLQNVGGHLGTAERTGFMDRKTYEKPRVVDYGSLQELTAACVGGTGGDAAFPGGNEIGKDVHTSQIQCHSN